MRAFSFAWPVLLGIFASILTKIGAHFCYTSGNDMFNFWGFILNVMGYILLGYSLGYAILKSGYTKTTALVVLALVFIPLYIINDKMMLNHFINERVTLDKKSTNDIWTWYNGELKGRTGKSGFTGYMLQQFFYNAKPDGSYDKAAWLDILAKVGLRLATMFFYFKIITYGYGVARGDE